MASGDAATRAPLHGSHSGSSAAVKPDAVGAWLGQCTCHTDWIVGFRLEKGLHALRLSGSRCCFKQECRQYNSKKPLMVSHTRFCHTCFSHCLAVQRRAPALMLCHTATYIGLQSVSLQHSMRKTILPEEQRPEEPELGHLPAPAPATFGLGRQSADWQGAVPVSAALPACSARTPHFGYRGKLHIEVSA